MIRQRTNRLLQKSKASARRLLQTYPGQFQAAKPPALHAPVHRWPRCHGLRAALALAAPDPPPLTQPRRTRGSRRGRSWRCRSWHKRMTWRRPLRLTRGGWGGGGLGRGRRRRGSCRSAPSARRSSARRRRSASCRSAATASMLPASTPGSARTPPILPVGMSSTSSKRCPARYNLVM
ncbi:hypothetical protein ZWY2020_020696 [Hordeum vulgare]|nr:hypothetical protein ZWY2020_020696 [Hordeum vulgare]